MPRNVAVVTAVTPTIYQGYFLLTSLLAIWLTKHRFIKDKKYSLWELQNSEMEWSLKSNGREFLGL